MPFAKVRDIEMYYERRGDGPPLLFISGSGGDLRNEPNVFKSPLARHFDLLAYDQRGLGQTEKPDRDYSMADYADDAAALMDHVGWERAHVVGVSFGGMVAQEFALRHAERIKRLVLCCTSPGGKELASYPLHELTDMSVEERTRFMLAISDERHDEDWQKEHPDEVRRMLDFALKQAATGADDPLKEMGARRQLEARRHHDTYDRLPELKMPVLICAGKYDGIAPLENQHALKRQIPDAHLQLFEGGHLFLIQDPSAYHEIIEFLEKDT